MELHECVVAAREVRLSTANQTYHFRYRDLRLLAQSGDRMFFVPSQWTPRDGAALMLRDNADIRVQLYAG